LLKVTQEDGAQNDQAAPLADKNGAQRQMQNLRRASSDKFHCENIGSP
jgi:hypothetical protein